MRPTFFPTAVALAVAFAAVPPALGQTLASTAPEDSFSLDAAILDTSIPFALGAHEARQELRGAFGWPTFQEGLVEGVYFRFDPDGYARFSPTPRLDTDVFEVICRPRTHVCMARKNAMSVTLTTNGEIQIKLENIAEGDSFLIAEGISELQLPASILQPLDTRMELLLSGGGDLVVRRGQNQVDKISLSGFAAVSTYLRWVAAKQDYSVLPRSWPIPAVGTVPAPALLSQPQTWQSPMPQPVPSGTLAATESPEVAEVRGELRVLRELMLEQQNPPQSTSAQDLPPNSAHLLELQQALALLTEEVARLSKPMSPPPDPPATPEVIEYTPSSSEARNMADRLEYLMTEIGLAPDVALMLLQPTEASLPSDTSSDVLDDIINELRDQMPETENTEPAPQTSAHDEEYLLLSDYFRSVFDKD